MSASIGLDYCQALSLTLAAAMGIIAKVCCLHAWLTKLSENKVGWLSALRKLVCA